MTVSPPGIPDPDAARRFVCLATADRYGGRHGRYLEAKRILEERPEVAGWGVWAALVLGEAVAVRAALARDPGFVAAKGGPREREPLYYVTFSRFHREGPERAEGLLECARILLDAGADPNARSPAERQPDRLVTPLYGACGAANFPAMAELLLDRGADADDGVSLYHAVGQPDLACLRLLLERGADPTGTEALNHSFERPGMDRIRLLLRHGADPDEECGPRGTCLHVAISRGREVEALNVLVMNGADVHARRADGKNAWQIALQYGHVAAAAYLERFCVETEAGPADRFFAACGSGDVGSARAVLRSRPALFAEMSAAERRTFLDLADLGHTVMMASMLNCGFPVDLRGRRGETALHRAAWRAHVDVVRLLVSSGAPLEAVDDALGLTPLGWAAHGTEYCREPGGSHAAVVAALLEAGADAGVRSRWNEDLPGLACGNPRVAELLRNARDR